MQRLITFTWKRILTGLMVLIMAVSVFSGLSFTLKAKAAEETVLHNPVIVKDSTMSSGQKVTWDCVWFGNYPQTEVKETDSEYESLKSAEGWDSNGDIVINGTKYRRMLKGDATFTESELSGYYDWKDDTTYHYFRYEPVKWRVLKTDGSKAMLLSDIVLDDRKYNTEWESTTWEECTIRSWLNGYDADMNQEGISYSGSNFIDSAFTMEERSAIADTNVVNKGNLKCDIEGGNDTVDKVFLLSESEVYTDNAVTYGFASKLNKDDEARRCKSSDYAKAMGVYSFTSPDIAEHSSCKGNCWWWLRSPGYSTDSAVYVDYYGFINNDGDDVTYGSLSGVRVALNLNLSSSNLYTYAGTVCSDETVPRILKLTKSYTKTYGAKSFKLNAKLTKGNETLNETLKYTTSNKNIADVDKKGRITIKGTGICTITVKADATDIYESISEKITITVKPMKNTVTKVKASGSRTLNVTWKKDTKGAGYELQYSTTKKFTKKSTKTINIGKNKTTSYKIRKLEKGKKYYIRVRTYQKVKVEGKAAKLYGSWSAVKQSGKVI
ncbi:MAG: fibronectin type III domain-containing protein [Lachnospiraceae bacterium]|nr:fibronectin type III domain-containing protein [Lachnospiraceae bacterium]